VRLSGSKKKTKRATCTASRISAGILSQVVNRNLDCLTRSFVETLQEKKTDSRSAQKKLVLSSRGPCASNLAASGGGGPCPQFDKACVGSDKKESKPNSPVNPVESSKNQKKKKPQGKKRLYATDFPLGGLTSKEKLDVKKFLQ